MTKKIIKTDDQWREQLSDEQFQVCRRKGTEAPFSGKYVDNHEQGRYHCSCCDAELFSSDEKFDSKSGWPSFLKPVNESAVAFIKDTSHGMERTEAQCQQCDAHLGHVFPDGPPPSGLRFCINSVALTFKSK